MLLFIMKRIVIAVPTLFLVALIVFVLMRSIPGDPAALFLGDSATPESIAALRDSLGLDEPLPVQFVSWLSNVFQGDLGASISSRQPVLPLVLNHLKLSATIVLVAVGLAVLIAVPAGMIAAWRQGRMLDNIIVPLAIVGLSIPTFWLGVMILSLFGVRLGWLPVVGYANVAGTWESWRFMVMPILSLVIVEVGVITRMVRSSTIEVLRLEYVTHARAKGLSEFAVLARHVFPTAFAPTLTLIGMILGTLLGGMAVLETVFTLPGLGRLLVQSVFARDYPVIQACLLIVATGYIIINVIVDIIYPVLDPRIAYE